MKNKSRINLPFKYRLEEAANFSLVVVDALFLHQLLKVLERIHQVDELVEYYSAGPFSKTRLFSSWIHTCTNSILPVTTYQTSEAVDEISSSPKLLSGAIYLGVPPLLVSVLSLLAS